MSLVPFATRICTVRAFQAVMPETVVVIDSPQEPLTMLDDDTPKPVIAVYTGASRTKYDGRNLLGGMPVLALTIQILLPETFSFSLDGGEPVVIDTRRQGAETALDVFWRIGALALNSSSEPWAELWREFVLLTPAVANNSYLIERQGVRVTAREITIECEPIHEPVLGGEPSGAWARLIEQMRDDNAGDGLALLADWVEGEIRNGPDRPQLKRDTAYLGLSEYVASAIRVDINPESVANSDETPLAEASADPNWSL